MGKCTFEWTLNVSYILPKHFWKLKTSKDNTSGPSPFDSSGYQQIILWCFNTCQQRQTSNLFYYNLFYYFWNCEDTIGNFKLSNLNSKMHFLILKSMNVEYKEGEGTSVLPGCSLKGAHTAKACRRRRVLTR